MTAPDRVMVISATVVTSDPEQATRAAEVFGRAAAGLILDGINVTINMGIPEDEPEPEDPT